MKTSRFSINGILQARVTWYGLKATIVAVALATTLDATAGDAKHVSGVACFFQDNSGHFSHNRASHFQNTSGTSRVVTCPIVKDIIAGSVSVFLRASNTVDPNTCFVTRRFGGASVDAFSHNTVVAKPFFTHEIGWNPIPGPVGTFAVQCLVPSLSRILFVQHTEE